MMKGTGTRLLIGGLIAFAGFTKSWAGAGETQDDAKPKEQRP